MHTFTQKKIINEKGALSLLDLFKINQSLKDKRDEAKEEWINEKSRWAEYISQLFEDHRNITM